MNRQRLLLSSVLASLFASSALAGGEIDRWYMSEEWYDWHPWSAFAPDKTGSVSVEMHFVGPGAPTPRGIYVRGDARAPLDRVRIISLTDHRGETVETDPVVVEVAGTPDGNKWVRLARGAFCRGYKMLTLKLPEELVTTSPAFDYICVSPNESYFTDGRAERWIRDREKGKEVRCGMPLGGIGAGKIEIARDGWLRNVTINNNIDAPFYHPELCFLAASVNGKPRVLRDEPALGLKPVGKIEFDARYPIAHVTFSEPDWPIEVKLTAWSPIIPGHLDDSSLPVALFEFTLDNTTAENVEAQIAVSWENLLGMTGRPQPLGLWGKTGHYYRCREERGNNTSLSRLGPSGVVFMSGSKTEPDAEGNYSLALPAGRPDLVYTVLPQYGTDSAQRDGVLFPASPDMVVRPVNAAAVSAWAKLAPGQKMTVPFVLAWYMDHFHQMGDEDLGHCYQRRFKDSTEVAQYVFDNYDRLLGETRALHDLFDRSDLPAWCTHTLLNDLYVLSTDTWLTRDGRFSVNEGATNMYGVMGTMDQKLYASHHLALLFPRLQEQELRQFGQLQNDNGGVTHDLGTGQFVAKNHAFDWPDLCSAFAILSYQVYRYTGDKAFWDEIRPKVIKAIDCLAGAWDPDGLGVPGRGSTFDDEDSYRIFSYTAGLYLCDLKLGMGIARELGDEQLFARYRQRYDRAYELAMKELWTGRYFRYGSSPPPENKRTDASHFSQLAGEFWCRVLGFEPIFEPEVRKTALENLLRLHWNENFKLPPKIVLPDGTLFPRDGQHRNAPVSWPMHARAMMCGPALLFGREQAGWDLLRAMRENIIAANGPDPWDQSLYYDPITARLDWGVFYMTAPASWLAYQALIDTYYDAVTGTLTFRPQAAATVTPGKLPIITPTFWALAEVPPEPDGRRLSIVVEKLLADRVSVNALRLGDDARAATVRLDGQAVGAIMQQDTLVLDAPMDLRPGRRIELAMEKRQ